MGAYNVKYMPRIVVKGQVLVDFIAKFAEGIPEKESAVVGTLVSSAIVAPSWNVYTNGASNRKGVGSRGCVKHS